MRELRVIVHDPFYLPTSRANHIATSPNAIMANLHGDCTKISPTWCRISRTAFQDRASLCGGLGRRIQVQQQHLRGTRRGQTKEIRRGQEADNRGKD